MSLNNELKANELRKTYEKNSAHYDVNEIEGIKNHYKKQTQESVAQSKPDTPKNG